MCTRVRITFIGLLFLGLGTSSDAESGSNHGNQATSLDYAIEGNSTVIFFEDRVGTNVLAVPIASIEPQDVLSLFNNLTKFINNGEEVVNNDPDVEYKVYGYHVMNGNITIPFTILVTENQTLTILERIMSEFVKDESIINKLYNYTIFPGIDLQLILVLDLIIPGCENITLKYYNLVQKFESFKTFYTQNIENVCAIIIILGSLLICGCILKSKRLRTPQNVYMFSLAVSVIPQSTVELFKPERPDLYDLTEFLIFSGWKAGVFSAVGITIDRYIAICHPSFRCRMFTYRRTVQVNVTIWVLSLIASLIEIVSGLMYEDNKYFIIYSLIMFIVLPTCIILLSLICIARSSWLSAKMKQSCSNEEQPSTEKSIKIAAVIAIEYLLCWAPYGGYNMLMKIMEPSEYDIFYTFILLQLFLLGSLFNPILYPLVSKDFRNAYKDLILLCIGCIRRWFCSGKSPRHGESRAVLHAMDEESNISLN